VADNPFNAPDERHGRQRDRLAEPMASVLASLPAVVSPWAVVDALVPGCADLAWIALESGPRLRVCAYAHLDPLRLKALEEFQHFYAPAVEDPRSFMARVLRTSTPEIVHPDALAQVEREGSNAGTRAALRALGPRTSLIVPVLDAVDPARSRGILLAAMSSSGRRVDEDDLADLARFARQLSPRLHW